MAILKWNVHPDKVEAYVKWSEGAVRRVLAVPGVVEFRAYRTIAGSYQVVLTYEFADLSSYAAWYVNKDVQKVLDEAYTLTLNMTSELWGPSPIVPEPIRPRK
jgi:antibiotic biosynthesis monooxygenase (ABM) superfamily enzyme